ncbi:MAG: Xylose isomerase protein barrel [Clostridia bacterium]|nr:Xylose isomerase protein barrel [Clostridia bacterium]
MIRLGCCISHGTFVPIIKNENIQVRKKDILKSEYDIIINSGYDFIESTVGFINNMTEDEFTAACDFVKRNEFKIEVANSFIPSELHITGNNVSKDLLNEYVCKSMIRLKALGGSLIVFGSGSARRVPDDFPRNKAIEQIYEFLEICARQGEQNEIYIVIEPLNKSETNIINTVTEGLEYVEAINKSYVRLLADSYHFYKENEDLSVLNKAAPYLKHIHIAEPYNRTYPGDEGGEYLKKFIHTLDNIKYTGNISIECKFKDFNVEIYKSYKFLKELKVNWAIK